MRRKERRCQNDGGRKVFGLFGRRGGTGGTVRAPAASRPQERPRRDYGKPLKITKAPVKTRPVSPGDVVRKNANNRKKRGMVMQSIVKRREQSAELRAAQEKIAIAKLQTEIAREKAKAARIEADADRRAARNERYRAVTKTRSANGGASVRVVAANVPDIPKASARKTGPGGGRAPSSSAKGRTGRASKTEKGRQGHVKRK